jgi:hypothetical protein
MPGGLEPTRYLAIDWSGALDPAYQRKGIWIADLWLNDLNLDTLPQPPTLRSGESRVAVEALLIKIAQQTPATIAGIDFSFSYPQAFLHQLGCRSALELWDHITREGENWLTTPHPCFWGRGKGSRRPDGHLAPDWRGYRQTELQARSGNDLPRSSFQIGGAGAVGTGSLRGIPMLPRLRQAGWSIWPFDPPSLPLLVEIYPRLLTGPVVKSSPPPLSRTRRIR